MSEGSYSTGVVGEGADRGDAAEGGQDAACEVRHIRIVYWSEEERRRRSRETGGTGGGRCQWLSWLGLALCLVAQTPSVTSLSHNPIRLVGPPS